MEDCNKKLDIKHAVRAMGEYIILNSVATDSTSLFYGRAGMSICLFETARFLNDDYIDDYAFTLLQQSLLNEKNDIRFDAGLSGIGYALDYLIRNKFIDASFMEIFHKQHDIIVERFLCQNFLGMSLKALIQQCQLMLYFHYITDKRVEFKIKELNEVCIAKFRETWSALFNGQILLDKESIITLWKYYLKIMSLINSVRSFEHINEYICLLQKGLLKRDIQSLYCASIIASEKNDATFRNISTPTIVKYDISDFNPIDSMRVANVFSEPYVSCESVRCGIRKWFNNVTIEDMDEILNDKIGFSSSTVMLSLGLPRLALGLISIETSNNHIVNEILSVI